jgi:hypothetical protein
VSPAEARAVYTVESGNESLAVCFVAWYEREVEGAADARVVTVSDTLTFP